MPQFDGFVEFDVDADPDDDDYEDKVLAEQQRLQGLIDTALLTEGATATWEN